MMGLDQMEAGKRGEKFWRVFFFFVRAGRLAKQWVQGGVERN